MDFGGMDAEKPNNLSVTEYIPLIYMAYSLQTSDTQT